MKRVGILTFHWATNYGAVLQAYALQKCLDAMEFDAEVINYRPYRVLLIQKITKWRDQDHQKKECALRKFRKCIKMSKKTVYTEKKLATVFPQYDFLIAGSDQIWNESFTLGAEGKPTLSYFFRNCPLWVKRISYAASFGTEKVSETYKTHVKSELEQFSTISVRENSGGDIVRGLGLEAEVVCDPTLLLPKEVYWDLTNHLQMNSPSVFSYVLHGNALTEEIAQYVKRWKQDKSQMDEVYGLAEWLYCIQNADVVVTNSFHGVMLSIILNRPFVAVLMKGSGMNDRILTVLASTGLENRAVGTNEEKVIDTVLETPIDWDQVNERLEELREHGKAFLSKALTNEGES